MSLVTENQPDGTPTWIDLGIPDLDRAMELLRSAVRLGVRRRPARVRPLHDVPAARRAGRGAGAQPGSGSRPVLVERLLRHRRLRPHRRTDHGGRRHPGRGAGRRDGSGPAGHRPGSDGCPVRAVAGTQAHRRPAGERAGVAGAQRPGHPGSGAGPRVLRRRSSTSPWTATRTCRSSTSRSCAGPTGTRSAASWALPAPRARSGTPPSRSRTPTPWWPRRRRPAGRPARSRT